MQKKWQILWITAIAVLLFSNVSFGAEAATIQEKFDALKQKGIVDGFEDGSAGLDQKMTRAQFAKVAAVVFNLPEDQSASEAFSDLDGASWAAGYIGAGTKAGLFNGVAAGKFDPSGEVTLEQMAVVFVRAFHLSADVNAEVRGKASDWAQGSVAVAIKVGLIAEKADYTAPATRSELTEAAYAAVFHAPKPEFKGAVANKSATAPVIDGKIDDSWAASAAYTFNTLVIGSVPSEEDPSAKFRLQWDEDNLYLLVDVTDPDKMVDNEPPAVWKDDSIEVYLDGDNSKSSKYDENDFQYMFRRSDQAVYELKADNTKGVVMAQSETDNGYVMEIRFPLSVIGAKAVSGSEVGFQIQLNDDDNGQNRDSQVIWWGSTDQAHNNPKTFGTIMLKTE